MIHIYDANAYLRSDLNRHDGIAHLSPRFVYEAVNASPYPQVWVWDGPGNNDRRRAIFPGYKIRDYTGQESIFAGLKLYRELLALSSATQIEVPGWEADDVCHTLAMHYANRGAPVLVHTNDFDFHQIQHPLVKIKGMRPIEGVPQEFVRLYKTLRGDNSDKIPGLPGFGAKAWESFAGIWGLLDKAFQEKDVETIRAQPFTPKTRAWLASDENLDLLFAYYEITRLMTVPLDEIEKHSIPGQPDPAGVQQIFARFML